MTLYAESSAVLSWLLSEPGSEPVRESLMEAELIVASDLTLIECDRALIRATRLLRLAEAAAADRRALLSRVSSHWTVLRVGAEIVQRARQPFPAEPLRTLDALHLSSALFARAMVPGLRILSLDERIRESSVALGFEVSPAA